jgi:hypothetical protein
MRVCCERDVARSIQLRFPLSLARQEPRAIIGVPVALAIVLYLMSKRVRHYFAQAKNGSVNSWQ